MVPARYRSMCFKAAKCCRLGLAVYDASRLTAKAISGRVEFARNWSSPNNLAKELLWFPSFPSGLGSSLIFRSRGVATLLIPLRPSLLRFFFSSSAHVFLMSDCCFTSSLFHHFDRFRSTFHYHAFYFYMFTTCISTHVFHTCYLHVYFLLTYYMPCKHGLLVYKLVCRLSCFFS